MLRRTLSGLILFVLSGVLVAQTGQFLEAPQYSTGTNPQAVATGDFRGNGNLDLVVANSTANTISVLLSNGNGTYQPQVVYPTGGAPLGVAVADFNGDGLPDIAVTNSASNTLGIFLGNGNGTFQAQVTYKTGKKPVGLAVGDFNGDGHLDLIVTNATDNTAQIFLNSGSGTFTAQAAFGAGTNPYSVAVGDFNNDGIPDFAVANNSNTNSTANISVFLGNGTGGVANGTFQGPFPNPVATGSGHTPIAIAVGYFTGTPSTSNLDIAVADQAGDGVSILLGNGDGSFQPFVEYTTAAFPTALIVGDFDGDGNMDVAVSAGASNSVTVLWGTGEGTFGGYINIGIGDIPYGLVAGDFNNNGTTDFAVVNSGSNNVSVALSNGNRTFQARIDYPVGPAPAGATGPNPHSVATADFNGDGFLDLAIANDYCPENSNCGTGSIAIMLGNGDGTFQGPTQNVTATGTDPYAVVAGDFNGDGIPDLAVAYYGAGMVGIMLGNGDGTFGSPTTFTVGGEPASLAVGHFIAGGPLDLVVTNFSNNSNSISVLLGNGDGTFKTAVNYPVGEGPVSVAMGDFNGDKIPDLVVVNESANNVSILLGNGDGTFRTAVEYPTGVGGNPLSVVVGDFTGNGTLDLAVADFQTQEVSILLGIGDGTFKAAKTYPTGANPYSVVTADFNGDGVPDLAVTSTGNVVSLLLGNGDGSFSAPVTPLPSLFGVGTLAYTAVVGDFNGDGAVDLAVTNGSNGSTVNSNTVSILLNTEGTTIRAESVPNSSFFGQPVTITTQVAASVVDNLPVPTGTITIKNGSTTVASGSLTAGQVILNTSALPVGTDTLSVIYSGEANTFASHTVTLSQTVQMANTTTGLISSLNPSGVNQSVTFTATVAPQATGIPTGTVTFLDGATQLGASTLSGGVATLSTSSLALGTHSITATYNGDGNFNTSTSSLVSQVVANPAFTISSTTLTPPSVAPGSSATSTVTITPTGGLDPSTVALTCSVLPAANPPATCSLGAISVANNLGTSTLTVTTIGTQAALAPPAGQSGSGKLFALALLVPAILLGGAGLNRPGRRKLLGFFVIFLALSACLFQVACSSGSSNSTPPPGNQGTPGGTYTVTITGTVTGMPAQNATASLTVQ